jgi:hypothetical protein
MSRAILRLNPIEFFFKIMIPAAAPYIFTGLRIGIGLSWLAIVAAEMLTGGVGIGFFIWDAWNSSRLPDIIVALVYIGIVGFVLDRLVAGIGAFATRGTAKRTEGVHHDCPISRSITSTRASSAAGDDRGAEGHRQLDIEQGEVRLHHRSLGLRQVDAAQPDRRPDPLTTGAILLENASVAIPGRTAPWCSRTTRCCRG